MSNPRKTAEELLAIVEKIEKAVSELQQPGKVQKSTAPDMQQVSEPTYQESDIQTDTAHVSQRDTQIFRRLTQGWTLSSEMPNQFNNMLVDLVFKRTDGAFKNTAVSPYHQGGNN